MSRVTLTKEKETLLIPLYGKAQEARKRSPILVDEKAMEILAKVDYDFSSLRIPEKTNIMMCLRAKIMDDFVRQFLLTHPRSVALHLGCGLDSRYDRIGPRDADWYDVDYPEVIDIRREFYPETERYHMISSSVTDHGWLDKIQSREAECIVIAEGLFMYLKEADIRALIARLRERVGGFTLLFDAFSELTAKKVGAHPSLKKTGATIGWGIDDPQYLSTWGLGIGQIQEIYLTSSPEIKNLDPGTRAMFRLAGLFPVARRAHRIVVSRVSV